MIIRISCEIFPPVAILNITKFELRNYMKIHQQFDNSDHRFKHLLKHFRLTNNLIRMNIHDGCKI